jgi:hypothetical protein
MKSNLILPMRRKEIEISSSGNVVEGEIVGKVHYFRVERYDTWTYYKNEKHYSTFKEAFKALIGKVKKYPGVSYVLQMYYFDNMINSGTSTCLFYTRKNKQEDFITMKYGYERDFFCTLYLEDNSIEFDEGDINEGNTLLADWLPKKRNNSPTLLQQRIESFQKYNILKIDFKGIVTDEKKDKLFEEMNHCFEQIDKIFPMSDYYPVQDVYFAKYKTARGKYGQAKISLNPDCHYAIRDTIYHEYGHFLFDVGQYGNYPYFYKGKVDRDEAISVMDRLLNVLYEEETLKEIDNQADIRMQYRGKKASNLLEKEKFRSKHEEYLLRPTEVFARLFESFMLSIDKKQGESLLYSLDFTEKEIEKVKPLLLEYLSLIRKDYHQEQATS